MKIEVHASALALTILTPAILFVAVRRHYMRKLQTLELKRQELERQLTIDEGTGVYTSHVLMDVLARNFLASRMSGKPFAIALIDVDDFGRINEEYSYDTGDKVLKQIAKLLNEFSKSPDQMVIRFKHGDEFLIVSSGMDRSEATAHAEKMRERIAEMELRLKAGEPLFKLSISIGVTSWTPKDESPSAVLARAEKALRQAKSRTNSVAAS
jgi:diguanylate cyclase (GGDEF)-like protein